MISKAIKAALALIVLPMVAEANCRNITFEDLPFTVCDADPSTDRVALFLNDPAGQRIGTFTKLRDLLSGETLSFAMNAGMYHPDRRPVGFYVEDGETLTNIVTRAGPGNFGLLPNGILCLTETTAAVIETRAFAEAPVACKYATQSGPMLVIDGALHPRFIPSSTSTFIRNGVGVRQDGTLLAVISNAPVNFHTFARLFRDTLQTPNALYLDGNISRLHAPDLNRSDLGLPLGPILGVLKPDD